ncbi:hypothetical protein DNK48_24545 [Streptomyces malaysiensis subsp. malaysiensis]|uniref:hypothetical protein n=1 Tax=Streptomyces malaysiensis TaxID=92644 RepID=UPI000BFE8175|nr:hypothetical protein [Streptomyces malaysiensis]ATL83956.1 hypothetical protein SMALA_3723 [Streptomyces malaysiensis]QDL72012.1 hypothetical protein DNK48_24545 [Streptomyces malaysiensis]
MSRPTISEISALLADLADFRTRGAGSRAELMHRKADLLERIAAARPDDAEAAEVAAAARARADELTAEG